MSGRSRNLSKTKVGEMRRLTIGVFLFLGTLLGTYLAASVCIGLLAGMTLPALGMEITLRGPVSTSMSMASFVIAVLTAFWVVKQHIQKPG